MIPVILSGGSGSRLWPVSREAHPKPFIKLADGESLLQKTYRRAAALPGVSSVLTVTNRDYYFLTRDEYAGLTPVIENRYLLEPCGRNTAPAVLLAALHCAAQVGPETVLLVLAADHVIEDDAAFQQAVAEAERLAGEGWLVTFGIVPTAPETGYGYIERAAALSDAAYVVSRFVEKPPLAEAEAYLAGGCHFWNSGMFCFTAAALLAAAARHAPDLLAAARAVFAAMPAEANSGPLAWELPAQPFAAMANISLDYALMERAERVAVVPASLGWSDVGSWDALAALTPADAQGNRLLGETELLDSHDCYIHNSGRLVTAIGVHDLVIVDTPDALLIADRSRAQEVRQLVARLKEREHPSALLHLTVARPWGTYTVLEEGPGFKIKRIVVRPGASLSLQMHRHRSEHWVVVGGCARVINGERQFDVNINESTFIPAGCQHRLTNPGTADLAIIEVQTGDYVGEDDIIRFDDHYGRQ